MKNIRHLTCALFNSIAFGAHAQSNDAGAKTPQVAAPQATAATPNTEGVIRKVDKEQGKLSIKHGPIANLDMPGMTMVFRMLDTKALETLKAGDKVRFFADKVNGTLTVMAIETVR
ncbi:MAG: copper-binding protein [Burkholderiales bacterium]